MTKLLHKKAEFRVFMVDAAKNINVKLKDVKVPRGVLERMEREDHYQQTLQRQRNQDWFGLPIKTKIGAFKKIRYRASRALRIRSAKKEMKEYVLIENIDRAKQFYLGKPTKCKVGYVESNVEAIEKCKMGDDVLDNYDDYSLLIMKNGGENLKQFAEKNKKCYR